MEITLHNNLFSQKKLITLTFHCEITIINEVYIDNFDNLKSGTAQKKHMPHHS